MSNIWGADQNKESVFLHEKGPIIKKHFLTKGSKTTIGDVP
ncbi:hypothetical protein AB1J28_16370 [Lysinibacillus irui]